MRCEQALGTRRVVTREPFISFNQRHTLICFKKQDTQGRDNPRDTQGRYNRYCACMMGLTCVDELHLVQERHSPKQLPPKDLHLTQRERTVRVLPATSRPRSTTALHHYPKPESRSTTALDDYRRPGPGNRASPSGLAVQHRMGMRGLGIAQRDHAIMGSCCPGKMNEIRHR